MECNEVCAFKVWCIHSTPCLFIRGSLSSSDGAKLKGYYLKWKNAKYLLGSALFVDLLTLCNILSKVVQHDDLFSLFSLVCNDL